MKIIDKFAYASFLLICNLLIISGTVKAAGTDSFSISPPTFDISANPGDSVKNTIKIQNLSDSQLTLTVKSENFVAYGEGGQVNLTDNESSYSINQWLHLGTTQFNIDAHKTYLYDFSILIPLNAEPGSHYGAVVFSNGSPTAQTGSVANVVQEIGALVLIKIPGAVTEQASLLSFSPDSQYFTDPKVNMSALVENTGGVHFSITGTITIYDIFGNAVKTVAITSHNVLPGSKRLFTEGFDFEGFGYFNAKLVMNYSSGTKTLTGETRFTSLNVQRSIPITLVIIIVGTVLIVFRKRIVKAVKIIVKG